MATTPFGLSIGDLLLLLYAGALTALVAASISLFLGFPRLRPGRLEEAPRVSVVLPVRNEEATVRACVDSLLAQDYPDFEVIVVEGRSEDATRTVLEGYGARIRLLEEAPLPAGWVGKNRACWQGYRAATGDRLLFTDGDTRHAPDLLRRAVATLQGEGLNLLTLSPTLRVASFWEKALLPLVIFLIGLSQRGARVNRPDTKWALANGQYLLFPRSAYEALGGHEAVRGRVDEDYRLARRVKGTGRRLWMADARGLLEVRMYAGLRGIWYGFAKNAFPGLDFRLDRTVGNVASLFGLALLPFLLLAVGVAVRLLGGASLLLPVGALLTGLVVARTALAFHHLGTPAGYALLLPLSTALMMGILLDSARRYLRGEGVPWKGRTYGMPPR